VEGISSIAVCVTKRDATSSMGRCQLFSFGRIIIPQCNWIHQPQAINKTTRCMYLNIHPAIDCVAVLYYYCCYKIVIAGAGEAAYSAVCDISLCRNLFFCCITIVIITLMMHVAMCGYWVMLVFIYLCCLS